MKKNLGKSRQGRIQKMQHLLENSPRSEVDSAIKNIYPQNNTEMGLNLHMKNREIFGEKSEKTYELLTHILNQNLPKNATKAMKYRMSRPKAKEFLKNKVLTRKERTKKITDTIVSKVQSFYKQQAISTLSPSYREASQKKVHEGICALVLEKLIKYLERKMKM